MQSGYDILIVEDNIEQANLTKMLMEEFGFTANFVTDSTSALDTIVTDQPRVVILDLMMPELDGLRLCQQIKNSETAADTKVIIYSGKMYDSDRRKALELGADAFFIKPTRANTLIEKIKELLVTNGTHQS
ncbi:MAG TPA: response regulator [Calditrichia bacterium]|nr:response regulator [Calditrichota bacterium]HQU73725.1 response regulator [Calditrichia bacterium]HQV31496.1 response regulator [Calditrichia bacterium]